MLHIWFLIFNLILNYIMNEWMNMISNYPYLLFYKSCLIFLLVFDKILFLRFAELIMTDYLYYYYIIFLLYYLVLSNIIILQILFIFIIW